MGREGALSGSGVAVGKVVASPGPGVNVVAAPVPQRRHVQNLVGSKEPISQEPENDGPGESGCAKEPVTTWNHDGHVEWEHVDDLSLAVAG